MKNKKPTIKTASDLKFYHNKLVGSHFFDRDTMRFFGDTMSNYYVPVIKGKAFELKYKTDEGKTSTCYALQRRHSVNEGMINTEYFDSVTLEHLYKPEFID